MLQNLFKNKASVLAGIDISSDSVKLLTLSKNKEQRYQVEAFASVPLAEGAVLDKEIKNSAAVTEAIQQAIKTSQTRAKHAAVSLADSSVITKVFSMDASMSEIEMEANIMLEADKHIPYKLEEIRIDYQILGPSKGDERKVDVMLAASRAETVDAYVDAIENSGLKVNVVDVESYVMQQACTLITDQLPNHGNQNTIAVVDIGKTRINFMVFHNLMPIFTRSENIGGEKLVQEIVEKSGMSYYEAEEALQQNNLPDNYEQQILQPFKTSIVQYIRRGVQFFSSAGQYSEISHIIIAGGVASMSGLTELVTAEIGVNASIAQPFVNMTLSPKVNPKLLNNCASSLMLSCGLAIRSFENAGI